MKTTIALAIIVLGSALSVRAQEINARITISEIFCKSATEGGLSDRDELYVLAAGTAPVGQVSKRLPAIDDYYEYHTGQLDSLIRPRVFKVMLPVLGKRSIPFPRFTNRDQQEQGTPQIWSGTLAPGQKARILVSFNEQDNKDLTKIKKFLAKVVQKMSTDDSEIAAVLRAIPTPEKDDHIGTFLITATNSGGKLVTRFDEIRDASLSSRTGNSQKVSLRGSGSYDVVVNYKRE